MAWFKCTVDNQWDGITGYRKGKRYEFAANPDADLFTAISSAQADKILLEQKTLPAHKDLQGDHHVHVPVQFEDSISVQTLDVDYIDYNTTPDAQPHVVGRTSWDSNKGTLSADIAPDDSSILLGMDVVKRVINKTGSTISCGKVVYVSFSDATTNLPTIDLATADGTVPITDVIGVTMSDIENDDPGNVKFLGIVDCVDTSSFSVGDQLWLSASVAGTVQATRPVGANNLAYIGRVTKIDATDGMVDLNVRVGARIKDSLTSFFTSNGTGAGTVYIAGYYDFAAADANLSQASTTQTYGSSGGLYEAHATVVLGGPGTVDTGVVGLRVTGDSVDDAGGEIIGDSQVLMSDITTGVLDQYVETTKKWSSTVTFELYVVSGSPTAYSLDFNYGFVKYNDFGNQDFTIYGWEIVGLCGGTDTGFEVRLIHHNQAGWTYSATGFTPGNGEVDRTTSLTHDDIINNKHFAHKNLNLNEFIEGTAEEGLIIEITTTNNNAVQAMNVEIQVLQDPI